MGLLRIMGGLGELARTVWARLTGRRHYLLMDGMHSCAYIPNETYRYMNKLLMKRLEVDPKAENSLRFLWSRSNGRFVLAVNPEGVEMTGTHGLTLDTGRRVLIPCPYIQQIYQAYELKPEWCGRMIIRELVDKSNGKDKPWLALFELRV